MVTPVIGNYNKYSKKKKESIMKAQHNKIANVAGSD